MNTQKNQELKESLYALQSLDKNFFLQDTLEYHFYLYNNVELQYLTQQLLNFGYASSLHSNLCDHSFNLQLLRKFNYTPSRLQLIYRGSQDGLNLNSFWEKCGSKTYTIIICKSRNGIVFGGYQRDSLERQTKIQRDCDSFLFNCKKREFYHNKDTYSNIQNPYSEQEKFGFGKDLWFSSNFQRGSSKLGSSFSVDNYKAKYENFNPYTHLMGSEQPELVEMEVFQFY